MKKILLLTLVLINSLFFTLLVTSEVFADPQETPEVLSGRYCSGEPEYKNCKKAFECGYFYWRVKDKDHCKNATNFRGLNIKKYVDKYPNGILAKAIAEGTKQSRAKNVPNDSGSGGGGGGSGSGSSTTPAPATDIDNSAQDDKETQDGINIAGKSIAAGEIDLDENDAKKAGLENKTGDQIFKGVLNAVYSVTAAIAVIVIIVAGIMYITSDGDPSRASDAKRAIIYACVGLVITGSAFIITSVVLGLVF